jgi:hypothetical protein
MTDKSQTTKALHPCAGMTNAQRAAFEAVAAGMEPRAASRTIRALLDCGVLTCKERVVGRDIFGAIRVPVYELPLSVHMQWCEWCAENVKEATDAKA